MSQASVLASQRTHDFATASVLALLAMLACRLGLDLLPPTAFAWPPQVPRNLDFGVVALFLPLAALVFGIVVEAALLVARGDLPSEPPPSARGHWRRA